MKKIIALLLISSLTFSACLYRAQKNRKSADTFKAQESVENTSIDVPLSDDFLASLPEERAFSAEDGYVLENAAFGWGDPYFNVSLQRPESWTVSTVWHDYVEYTSPDYLDGMQIYIVKPEDPLVQNYTTCEEAVAGLILIETQYDSSETLTVHGNQWERLRYNYEGFSGIDQCAQIDDHLIVMLSFGVDSLTDSGENPISTELEKILNDLYLSAINEV